MSGKRYPGGGAGLGRELTQFGDALSNVKYDNINTEWEKIDAFDVFAGVSLDDSRYLLRQIERIENNVVYVFDFAITALSLFRDFLFFLPNFMNAVITYIAGIIYNALDSFLRLGVYALVVPPNLSDVTSSIGLPTTSLREQADNAYKKFYDYADPNIPYYLPFEKNLAEEIIDSGEKIKNKYKSYFEESILTTDNDLGLNINPSGDKKAYMERDFTDFKKSVENLSRPLGIYDGIYLYFSINYSDPNAKATAFIEAIAGVAGLFGFPTLEGLMEEYDSLFRPKRKKIKILCDEKIDFNGIQRSIISNAKEYLRKVDIKTNKNVYKDPALKDFRIFESDPVSSMTQSRKDRISNKIADQINIDLDSMEVLFEQNFNQEVDFRLNTNSGYQSLLEDIKILSDEIKYYDLKAYITAILNGLPYASDFETLHSSLSASDITFENINNPNDYPNAISFINERTNFYQIYNRYYDAKEIGVNEETAALNDLLAASQRIVAIGERIKNETVFSFLSPDAAQSERISKYESKIKERDEIKKEIEERVKEDFATDVENISKAVTEKKKQLSYVLQIDGNADETITDTSKSGEITFLNNYYPNARRGSIYKSYLEKFYNFKSDADADYMYEITIEIDASTEDFSTKVDSFHSGQFVQIRKDIGGGVYEYKGSGIIISEVEEVFEDAGVGTWIKANFSDIVGLTADIKRLQNEVLGFQNLFEPNTTYIDAIIEWLKDVKTRILELIAILENLIEVLQKIASLQLTGTIWAKYVRQDDYDLTSMGLTDTSGLNLPTQKKKIDYLNLNTVQYYLSKIRRVDPDAADRITDKIIVLSNKTSDSDDKERKEEIRDSSVVSENDDNRDTIESAADTLKEGVKTQLTNRLDTISSMFNIGSAILADLDSEEGIVSTDDAITSEKDSSVATWEALIFSEIAKLEASSVDEFGFSLILLSYLPKGLPFYPIRFVAEKLGLQEQELRFAGGNSSVINNSISPVPLDELSVSTIESLMPDYTLANLEGMMIQKSKDTNPAVWLKPEPKSISVTLEPFACTRDFDFNKSGTGNVEGLDNVLSFLSVGGSTISITESLETKYLAGAKLSSSSGLAFQLDTAFNGRYKYRYEFTLEIIGPPLSCGADGQIDIDKIEVHFGVIVGAKFLTRKAYSLNDDGNEIFTFGRKTTKKFIGDVFLERNEIDLIPYILIGYEEDASLERFAFKLVDSKIYFYRVQ